MKQAKIRITNYTKSTTEDVWWRIGGKSDITMGDDPKPLVEFEIMEITCDEEHPVKHQTWGYDG